MVSTGRCSNHAERLAVARCLACRNSFCRECVTEHDGRLTCAACLRKRHPATARRTEWTRHFAVPLLAVAALCGSWLLFYTAGWWLEDLTAPKPSAKAAQR